MRLQIEFPVSSRVQLIGLVAGLSFVVGCSDLPGRVAAPKWDPGGFAEAVMEKLDSSGDGQIDQDELAPAPGLAFGAKFIDTNSDGLLSLDELVARFEFYVERRIGLTTKELHILFKGRPLAGVNVKLIPEFFLTELLETAEGVTDQAGSVFPEIENNELRTPTMRTGYYRIEITSPSVELPPGFSTAATLGVEVSPASDDMSTYGPIVLRLDAEKK
ncbi:MAG: EF-hand domain-containing protein [Pirellulales bacterium]